MTFRPFQPFRGFGGGVGSLDPLTVAFRDASGATALAGIDAIVRYCRAESLLNNIRFYPMRSAQNAGSGVTVYGIGSLTANNMTLFNSPTWGASGISFNGSNQYAATGDFLPGGNLTAGITARQLSDNSNVECWLGQVNYAGTQRSWAIRKRNDVLGKPMTVERHSSVNAGFSELYHSTAGGYRTAMETHVAQWVEGGGRSHWVDSAAQTLVLSLGLAQTSRANSAANISIAAFYNGSPFAHAHIETKCAYVTTDLLTSTQRETLDALINAL